MRQSKIQNYLEVAEVCAKRSHDAETKVGAVLVNNESGAIIATGYNGFVRGAPDSKLPNKRPEKYEYIVHAETNLICNAAHHGISTAGCTLICTHSPCKVCMRMLVNCGITEVIVRELYKDFDAVLKMEDVKVVLTKEAEGLYRLRYNVD